MGHLEQATRAQMATEGNITRGIRGVPVPTVRSTMHSPFLPFPSLNHGGPASLPAGPPCRQAEMTHLRL